MIGVILFHPNACRDVRDAIAWYDEKSVGLGEAFLADLQRLLERLRPFPLAYPEVLGVYRRASLSRFPYAVVYRCDDEAIIVLAVLHQRRQGRRPL